MNMEIINDIAAKKILVVANHGFDGTAHVRGVIEIELFREVVSALTAQGVFVTIENVFLACDKGTKTHEVLYRKGMMSKDQMERANAVVYRFLELALENL